MADFKIPEEEQYNELIKTRLQYMKDIAAFEGNFRKDHISGLFQSTAVLESFLALQEKSIQLQEKKIENETNDKRKEKLQAELEVMEELLDLKKQSKITDEEVKKALENASAARQKAEVLRKKMMKDANKDAVDSARKRKQDVVLEIDTLGNALQTALSVGIAAGHGALEMIQGLSNSPHFVALSAAFSKLGVNMGVSMGVIKTGLAKMAPSIDDNFRSIVKGTGLFSEEMYDQFTYALDPLYAMGKPGLFPAGMERPLINVGISAQDTGEAMKGLLNNVMTFRPAFMKANPEATAFTANLLAGMKKLGVNMGVSTKALNTFTKSFKQTPKQATKSVKSLLSVSKSLGINVGQAMKDFTGLMPTLAQFGDRAVEVFADLEAQSVATGMAVGELGKLAGGLDTFKGAAKAAQAFNAVMGDTLLDVNALVHADPADKITMIQEAMEQAGVSFEDSDRRMKQVIASTLGIDVEAAGKLFGSREDYEEVAAGVDTAAMSQQDLEKQITNTMTSGELLQKNLSSTGGAFREFVKKSRVAAKEGADTMFTAYGRVLDVTKSSEAAAMGILGSYTKVTNIMSDMANVNQGPLGPLKALIEGTIQTALIPVANAVASGAQELLDVTGIAPKPEGSPGAGELLTTGFESIADTTANIGGYVTGDTAPNTGAASFEDVLSEIRKTNELLGAALGPGAGQPMVLSVDGKDITGVVLDNMGKASTP